MNAHNRESAFSPPPLVPSTRPPVRVCGGFGGALALPSVSPVPALWSVGCCAAPSLHPSAPPAAPAPPLLNDIANAAAKMLEKKLSLSLSSLLLASPTYVRLTRRITNLVGDFVLMFGESTERQSDELQRGRRRDHTL